LLAGEGVAKASEMSYKELFRESQRWASALRAAGVVKGDRVAG